MSYGGHVFDMIARLKANRKQQTERRNKSKFNSLYKNTLVQTSGLTEKEKQELIADNTIKRHLQQKHERRALLIFSSGVVVLLIILFIIFSAFKM